MGEMYIIKVKSSDLVQYKTLPVVAWDYLIGGKKISFVMAFALVQDIDEIEKGSELSILM